MAKPVQSISSHHFTHSIASQLSLGGQSLSGGVHQPHYALHGQKLRQGPWALQIVGWLPVLGNGLGCTGS